MPLIPVVIAVGIFALAVAALWPSEAKASTRPERDVDQDLLPGAGQDDKATADDVKKAVTDAIKNEGKVAPPKVSVKKTVSAKPHVSVPSAEVPSGPSYDPAQEADRKALTAFVSALSLHNTTSKMVEDAKTIMDRHTSEFRNDFPEVEAAIRKNAELQHDPTSSTLLEEQGS